MGRQRQWETNMVAGFIEEREAAENCYKSKNLEAERKRRANLKNKFFTLRSLVPRITKMSKESTLADAIEYILELRSTKEQLQTELQNLSLQESLQLIPQRPQESSSDNLCCTEEVEVSFIAKNKLRASIVCRERKGIVAKIAEAVGAVDLEITGFSFFSPSKVSRVLLSLEVKSEKMISSERVKDLLMRVISES